MSISTAPKQGDGATVRPDGNGVDRRLIILGVVGVVVGLMAVVAVTTLDYVDVKVKGEKIGNIGLWRVDLNSDVIVNIGTVLETDPWTPKAVVARFLGENKRHKQINEDLIANSILCSNSTTQPTCDNIRSLTRLFVQSQGNLLPSATMILTVLLVLPIHTMRCTNQALVLTIISFIALVNIVAATANIIRNLETRVKDVFHEAFSPTISVSTEWRSGAIILFITTGLAGIFWIANLILWLSTRTDPYAPCDGPNFSEDNPMPPHFLPIAQREVKPPQDHHPYTEPAPHTGEEHNEPYGANNGHHHESGSVSD